MNRSSTAALLATCFCVCMVGSADTGFAEPTTCPPTDGVSYCFVETDGAMLGVAGSSADGGSVLVNLSTDGVVDLYFETFVIYSFDDGEFIDTVLDSATQDEDANVIRVQFTEATTQSVTAIGVLTLSRTGNATIVDEAVTVQSNVPVPVEGRLYAITDFDVNEGPEDESVTVTGGGTRIEQVDEGVTALLEVTGAPPDGFDVALCCSLGSIASDDLFMNLAGNTSVPGPGDFQSALSWDRTIAANDSVTFTLRKSLLLPEAGSGALGAAAALALWALPRSRARS